MTPAKSWLLRAADASGKHYGEDPAAYDPDFVVQHLPKFEAVFGPGRYFDTHVQGWEHITSEAAFIVSNHSGGTIVTDALGLGAVWHQHFQGALPLHGMVHEMVFATQALGSFFERCGALRANRALAEKAVVDFKRHLIVMPGGDRDVWRSSKERYHVHFAGRTGYAQTAIKLHTPIIPTAHVGAHHTFFVLTDGQKFSQKVGLIRQIARADVFPVHLSFPWGLAIGPWPHLPPPTRYDYRFSEPLEPPLRTGPAAIAAFDAEVRRAIQQSLDILRELRPKTGIQNTTKRLAEGIASLRALREVLREPTEETRD